MKFPKFYLAFALVFLTFPQLDVLAAGTDDEMNAAPPPSVPAERQADTRSRAVFSVLDDNDFFGKWSDKYYTNHTRLALTLGATDAGNGIRDALFFSFGQEIYTPKDRAVAVPDPRDHPYAGYLYASAGTVRFSDDFSVAAEIQLGATGDKSFAAQTQREYHRLIHEIRPAGWDTQIHGRFVAQAIGDVRSRIMLAGACGNEAFGADLVVRGVGDLGNLRGILSAGTQLRFGRNLPKDFGALPDMRRASSVAFDPRVSASIYAFADISADAVFWDKTLTGDSGGHADICAYPFVSELSFGVCAIYDCVSITFFQTFRSKEFTSQDHEFFIYGGFRASVFF